MRWLDRVPELSTDPGVHSSRTLNRQGPGALMGLLLPHPRRPWGTKTSDCISSGSNQVCPHPTTGVTWVSSDPIQIHSFLLEECSFSCVQFEIEPGVCSCCDVIELHSRPFLLFENFSTLIFCVRMNIHVHVFVRMSEENVRVLSHNVCPSVC